MNDIILGFLVINFALINVSAWIYAIVWAVSKIDKNQ